MDYNKQESMFLANLADDDSKSSKSDVCVNSRKHVITRRDGKKKIFVTFFETNYGNDFVINAKTNQPYPQVRYGSRHEDGLFSVVYATGETGQTPAILFYDSPQEYERHFNLKLKNETKQRWNKKQLQYKLSMLK